MPENKTNDLPTNIALMGKSKAISAVKTLIKRIATSDLPVLIKGEPGVGHSLVAREIHLLSPRCHAPFVEVNLAAIPRNLAASEILGHERGAFTGAVQMRVGALETAHPGTVFLGEIESTPEDIQGMLARVVEEPTIVRLGGEKPIPLDLRTIGGSGPNVESASSLRQDLVSCLSGFIIEMPPLRNRPEDIRILGEYLLKGESESACLSDFAWNRLEQYSFPGNLTELARIIKRAVILSDGKLITEEHLMLPTTAQLQDKGIINHLRPN
jgi:DNA-binding NtrC family response regulator